MNLTDAAVWLLPINSDHCIIVVNVDADRSQCQEIADECVPADWVNFATESDDGATYFHYGPGGSEL